MPLILDRASPTPLAAQIAAGIRSLVSAGTLTADQPVPSSRALAAQLGVARGTVVAAYDQLISEGYLVSRPGGATRVHPEAGTLSEFGSRPGSRTDQLDPAGPPAPASPVVHHAPHTTLPPGSPCGPRRLRNGDAFSPADGGHRRTCPGSTAHSGMPAAPHAQAAAWPSGVPAGHLGDRPDTRGPSSIIDLRPHRRAVPRMDDPAWRETWRRAATTSANGAMAPAEGLPELREAIAEHLRLMRAMRVDPAEVLVTSGARDGLALLLIALGEDIAPMAVEAPGYPGPRRVLHRLGMATVPAPVDAAGVVIPGLPAVARSLLVTPNHLFPAGGSMPAPRRLELLAHAAQAGLLVIEDDFDSEYRHVGPPLPTLRELAPESVVHLGTFNQVLTPEAALGYVITPHRLHAPLREAREDLGSGASPIAQRAVAGFLTSGGLRRRITRRRRELLRRRAQLLESLAAWPVEMVSGAHAVLRLNSAAEAARVVDACRDEGVLLGDLGRYWSDPEGPQRGPHGIVLNADVIPEDLARAVAVLQAALDR
nr:PLP-dependent aminotransferase family protein [Sediminivirga luteola]